MTDIAEDGRTWLLSGPSSSYALRLTDADELLHLHWGPRIALADAEALAERPPPGHWPFESPLDGREEYPVEGGPRFVRPALSVRTEDRRGTEWRFVSYAAAGDELRLRFDDDGVGVTLHYRMRGDVVERWVTVENGGHARVELLRADAATWTLPNREGWRLSQLHGRWAAESRLTSAPAHLRREGIGSRRGHTGHQAPALGRPGHRRHRGARRGLRLRARLVRFLAHRRRPTPRTRACRSPAAPATTTPACCSSRPGSRTPPRSSRACGATAASAARRAWHAYQRAHVIPDAERDRPVLFNSWEATYFDISGEQQAAPRPPGRRDRGRAVCGGRRLVRRHAATAPASATGRPTPTASPHGLKPLADQVHGLGMRFGIWVEPEMVNPDSDLYRAHPDWVQYQHGRKRTELRNQLVLNLAREDVRQYLWERLDTLLSSALIDYVKWDFNRCFTDAAWPGEPYPQRLWVDHVHALYALLDRLRAAHPRVAFESCSGRRRPDRPRRAEPYRPGVDLRQHRPAGPARHPARLHPDPPRARDGGLGHRQPQHAAQRAGQLAALPVRQCHGGRAGVGGDLTQWSAEELAEARRWVELRTRRSGPVVQHGDLYRLRPLGRPGAVQYLRGRRECRPRLAAGAEPRRAGPRRCGCADSTRQHRTNAVKRAKSTEVPPCCTTDCARDYSGDLDATVIRCAN